MFDNLHIKFCNFIINIFIETIHTCNKIKLIICNTGARIHNNVTIRKYFNISIIIFVLRYKYNYISIFYYL